MELDAHAFAFVSPMLPQSGLRVNGRGQVLIVHRPEGAQFKT